MAKSIIKRRHSAGSVAELSVDAGAMPRQDRGRSASPTSRDLAGASADLAPFNRPSSAEGGTRPRDQGTPQRGRSTDIHPRSERGWAPGDGERHDGDSNGSSDILHGLGRPPGTPSPEDPLISEFIGAKNAADIKPIRDAEPSTGSPPLTKSALAKVLDVLPAADYYEPPAPNSIERMLLDDRRPYVPKPVLPRPSAEYITTPDDGTLIVDFGGKNNDSQSEKLPPALYRSSDQRSQTWNFKTTTEASSRLERFRLPHLMEETPIGTRSELGTDTRSSVRGESGIERRVSMGDIELGPIDAAIPAVTPPGSELALPTLHERVNDFKRRVEEIKGPTGWVHRTTETARALYAEMLTKGPGALFIHAGVVKQFAALMVDVYVIEPLSKEHPILLNIFVRAAIKQALSKDAIGIAHLGTETPWKAASLKGMTGREVGLVTAQDLLGDGKFGNAGDLIVAADGHQLTQEEAAFNRGTELFNAAMKTVRSKQASHVVGSSWADLIQVACVAVASFSRGYNVNPDKAWEKALASSVHDLVGGMAIGLFLNVSKLRTFHNLKVANAEGESVNIRVPTHRILVSKDPNLLDQTFKFGQGIMLTGRAQFAKVTSDAETMSPKAFWSNWGTEMIKLASVMKEQATKSVSRLKGATHLETGFNVWREEQGRSWGAGMGVLASEILDGLLSEQPFFTKTPLGRGLKAAFVTSTYLVWLYGNLPLVNNRPSKLSTIPFKATADHIKDTAVDVWNIGRGNKKGATRLVAGSEAESWGKYLAHAGPVRDTLATGWDITHTIVGTGIVRGVGHAAFDAAALLPLLYFGVMHMFALTLRDFPSQAR